MFNPLPNADYARAGRNRFVGDRDMVMRWKSRPKRVAYPVRQMAINHVINDLS